MRSRKFKEANLAIGEGQEEYNTLHAKASQIDPEGKVTFCMELSEDEKAQVAKDGRIWVTMLTFKNPLMPILMQTETPEGCSVPEKEEDGE